MFVLLPHGGYVLPLSAW